jgi:hypothetical protein
LHAEIDPPAASLQVAGQIDFPMDDDGDDSDDDL